MEDIPKGIILVLMIITVLISVLGTWTVLDQLTSIKVHYLAPEVHKNTAAGYIQLTYAGPEQQPPRETSATGYITLIYEQPEGGK